ncbi:MAG: hypothetical protein QM793_15065 [Muricomes sp.]
MISTNKYLKLLAADDAEVKEIIAKLSEDDAKELLERLINHMNKERQPEQ